MQRIKPKFSHGLALGLFLVAALAYAADTKISALTELTNGNVAAGDLVPLVDVSDTSMAASGTDKKTLISSLATYFWNAPVLAGTATGTYTLAGTPTITAPTLSAGTASASTWPRIATGGTLLTTAEDGAMEMDDNTFYHTTDAGNRGYVPAKHCIRADATRTFTSNTTMQTIFTTPANGRLTLETGTYLISGLIDLTAMSATSGNLKFSINNGGTATLASILWTIHGIDAAHDATTAAVGGIGEVIATQTGANAMTSGTATVAIFTINGTFEVSAGGTIIPAIAQTTAAAAVVSVGSYLCVERIGSQSLTSIGQWD